MKTEGFKYYAFISYSHKDYKTAKRLHRRLQSYHLPSALLKSHPNLPKRLSPVFMDESNLVATGTLKEALYKNLDDSNYLIVICSPNSAKSEYVNDEVEYFIRTGRTDHIIPLIIDGVPHAEDELLECFPSAILDLPREHELLGIDLKKFGERDSFSRVIATLLKLDLDNFVDDEKRRRRRKIITFASTAAALMIAAGIFIWHNIIPHYNYYRTYVYKWEKPVGLFEVKNESERKKMEYTYKFTSVGGKVQKIERINSAGVLVDPSIITPFTELPMIRFVSDRTVEYYDVNGKKVYRKEYTKNFAAADFYRGDEDLPYAIQSNTPDLYSVNKNNFALADKQNSGNIVRLTLEHDENGYLVKKTFRLNNNGGYDNKGVEVKDAHGRNGIVYNVDEKGRVISVCYINKNGEFITIDGIYAEHIDYEKSPYPVKVRFADKNENSVLNAQGVSRILIDYDENFNVMKISYYGTNGERALHNEQGISEAVFIHDTDNGFLISESFYNNNLAPCECADNYSRAEISTDIYVRIAKRILYDANGERIIESDDLSDLTADEAFDMGNKYYKGERNLKSDHMKALQYYKRAAEQGHIKAQNALGAMYYNGYVIEKDYKLALKWLGKAAEQGIADAQRRLGYMYYHGYGVEQNYERAAQYYQKAAVQGDVNAQNNLGKIYMFGEGVEKDYKQAFEWYQKAADQGNVGAQHNLGVMYEYGYFVKKDYERAAEWYLKAADQGSSIAQNHLAYMYYYGRGVEKDYKQAFEWYQKAADQGNADAQHNLGFMYQYGYFVKRDYKRAAEWYQKAADQGYAGSQNNLAYMYEHGYGVKLNHKKAVEWYKKAAEQGNARAQNKLGFMYYYGIHVEQNEWISFVWYKRAAEQGNADAQYQLGFMYLLGEGVRQDDERAFEWYLKAAEQGLAHAQDSIGGMYEIGRGVKRDYTRAVEWYEKAAEQGYVRAQNTLGDMYALGKGVEQSYKIALEWYLKSADKGDNEAFMKLGNMYFCGHGVEKNFQTAYMWYYLAYLRGDKKAEGYFKEIERFELSHSITRDQIDEAISKAKKKYYELYEKETRR